MVPYYLFSVNAPGTVGTGVLPKCVHLWFNGFITSVPGDLDSSFIARSSWVNHSWKVISFLCTLEMGVVGNLVL